MWQWRGWVRDSCHKCKGNRHQFGKSEDIFNGIKHQIMSICMEYTNAFHFHHVASQSSSSSSLSVLVLFFRSFICLFSFTLRYSIFAMWIAIMPRYFNDNIKEDKEMKKLNITHARRPLKEWTECCFCCCCCAELNEWMNGAGERVNAYQLLKTTY